jgi:hypothetical protein
MSSRSVALVTAVVLTCLVGLAAPLGVRSAQTDDGEVISPDECTVDPLDTDEAIDRLLSPLEIPEEGPAGLPLYVEDEDDLPTGDEVPSRTQREIEDLVEQYVACTNAGQILRLMALFTEDGLPFAIMAGFAALTENEVLTESQAVQVLTQSLEVALTQPEALVMPEALWTALVEVEDAVELDDDLIGALVTFDAVTDPRPQESTFLLFAEEGGDLLIAGQVLVF